MTSAAETDSATVANRAAVLVLCGVTAGMLLLDLHKVTIAIPSIERALDAGPTGIQLVSAAYVVCFAVTLVPAGRIGDQGRRLALTYAGLWLSLVASIVCAVAPGVATLVVGRAALGVAAGLLMPQMMGIVQQLYAPHERGKAFGTYGICVSLSTALGPSVGGLLISLPVLGWRGVFVMNLPVTVALLVAAHRLLPAVGRAQSGGGRRPDVDVVGLLLGAAALVLVLTPFILTTGRPGDVGARWWVLLPAGLAAWAFVRRSRGRVAAGRSSVIDPSLLRITSFRHGVLVSLTWFASGPAVNLGLIIYLQEARGLSPLVTGLILLPSSATSILGAYLGGRLVDRWGRVLSGVGMTLVLATILGTLVLLHSAPSDPVLLVGIALLQLVSGLGGGLVVSPNHTMTLHDVPTGQGSAASSIGQLGQRVANSLGVAAASVAYYSLIYGAGETLASAPAALHLSSTDRTMAVAVFFLLLALAVVVADRRRQVRELLPVGAGRT
ncbi:MFS transporter [Aeromicrobium choanae]|uniref:Predicted arabinose efflux permease, MFS family n=1 Tax=Aeromicrobium choanae TaxID=1736691 RepID=A0A1T4YVN0_9ACTN|nr:MFS transporter [Aeromicrobium choanae]SKB05897.1 Predicted arabinose efflux permease, MFS family [Aeromicrobium choanae]